MIRIQRCFYVFVVSFCSTFYVPDRPTCFTNQSVLRKDYWPITAFKFIPFWPMTVPHLRHRDFSISFLHYVSMPIQLDTIFPLNRTMRDGLIYGRRGRYVPWGSVLSELTLIRIYSLATSLSTVRPRHTPTSSSKRTYLYSCNQKFVENLCE